MTAQELASLFDQWLRGRSGDVHNPLSDALIELGFDELAMMVRDNLVMRSRFQGFVPYPLQHEGFYHGSQELNRLAGRVVNSVFGSNATELHAMARLLTYLAVFVERKDDGVINHTTNIDKIAEEFVKKWYDGNRPPVFSEMDGLRCEEDKADA